MDLLSRANSGDQKALDELVAYEQEHGDLLGGYSWLRHTQNRALLFQLGKDSLYYRHVFERESEEIAREIEGPNPTPLEKILSQRVVACQWLVAETEARYAELKGCTIRQGEYWDRRHTQAHRRLLQAVKTLAEVRRLQMRPSVQVNIAEKQVNVAGDVGR